MMNDQCEVDLINIQTRFNRIQLFIKINKLQIFSWGVSKPQMKLCKHIWDKIIHWEGCYTLHHTKHPLLIKVCVCVCVCVCVWERESKTYFKIIANVDLFQLKNICISQLITHRNMDLKLFHTGVGLPTKYIYIYFEIFIVGLHHWLQGNWTVEVWLFLLESCGRKWNLMDRLNDLSVREENE